MSTANSWSSTFPQNNHLLSLPSENDDDPDSQYSGLTKEFYMEHAQKMEEIRTLLNRADESTPEVLLMIDAIQRLGIDYHFHDEIDAILGTHYRIFTTTNDGDDYISDNLYEVALRFRLLRQQDYHVTADAFNYFKDKEGKFEEKLGKDIRGLMGLYEASELSLQGEDILEEARNFSSQHLHAWSSSTTPNDDQHEARIVRSTLANSQHKSLARFMARRFLRDFRGTNGWMNSLAEAAKMDFDVVKSIHQKEILQVSKWWKELGLGEELKFARNQPVKWYMWPMAVLSDPSLSEQRVELTKPISLVYIIDDIFDVHGTLDELILFTEAVNRWDYETVEQLPSYMKICFDALNGITNEISSKVCQNYGWNPTDSLRKSWASLCNAFLVEARWFAAGYMPTTDDYLKNGIISSGVHVVLVHLFFLLGHGINKINVDTVDDFPGIISSASTILRLWDDLGSAKDEDQDGHDGSYIECYMKENPGASIESARSHVMQTISETWKLLNQQSLPPNSFSSHFTKACLNVARMVPLMYSYDVNQGLPSLEEHMNWLL